MPADILEKLPEECYRKLTPEEMDQILKCGIVRGKLEDPQFVHKTFGEFYEFDFFFEHLHLDKIQEVFIRKILGITRLGVIQSFFEARLQQELDEDQRKIVHKTLLKFLEFRKNVDFYSPSESLSLNLLLIYLKFFVDYKVDKEKKIAQKLLTNGGRESILLRLLNHNRDHGDAIFDVLARIKEFDQMLCPKDIDKFLYTLVKLGRKQDKKRFLHELMKTSKDFALKLASWLKDNLSVESLIKLFSKRDENNDDIWTLMNRHDDFYFDYCKQLLLHFDANSSEDDAVSSFESLTKFSAMQYLDSSKEVFVFGAQVNRENLLKLKLIDINDKFYDKEVCEFFTKMFISENFNNEIGCRYFCS
jgi:hypothetical protein